MNKKILICGLFAAGTFLQTQTSTAQKIREYVDKTGAEKLKKSVTVDGKPVTAKGFGDGHGKFPLLTSSTQLPDTIALITFYMYDLGSSDFSKAGNWANTTYHSVSAKGGNILANAVYDESIAELKAAYARQGVVLLTADEFLNTPEKKKFYYESFKPDISRLGTFLSGIENKHHDIAVNADNYRPLDVAAASDYLRAQSLGGELAKKLGVDAVLSIAVEMQSNGRYVDIHGLKMVLNGPNPVAKEDKKYVAQNLGNGYYSGQVYSAAHVFFKKPVKIANFRKGQLSEMSLDGIDAMVVACVEAMQEEIKESVATAAKKYN